MAVFNFGAQIVMKIQIIQWIIKQLFKFIVTQKEDELEVTKEKSTNTLNVVYYHGSKPVRIIETGFSRKYVFWLRASMRNKLLDPPQNWDVWLIENR